MPTATEPETTPGTAGGNAPALLRMLLAAACVVVILAGIEAVAPILTSFLVALVLAQVLSPAVLFLARRRIPQGAAIVATLLLVFAGLGGVVMLVAGSLGKLASHLPSYGQKLAGLRDQAFALLERLGMETADLAIGRLLDPGHAVGPVASVAGVLLADLGHAFFILLITALLLVELVVVFRKLERVDHAIRTPLVRFGEMSGNLRKYFGITALVGLIGSVGYTILLLVLGVPFVATWVVLYFLLGFIPTIGGVIAIVPVAIITLLELGLTQAVVLVGAFILMNFLLGDVLKPKIMQQGFEISMVTVFASLVFWNWLLGPVGMVLAVPLTITLRKLFQEFEPDIRRALTG